jgi:lysophospholipase L1-like esterase
MVRRWFLFAAALAVPASVLAGEAGAPPALAKGDKMLDEYSDISRKVAADTGVQMNDLRKAFVAYLTEHNKDNQPKGILTGDTVHLNAAGNRFVAAQMLLALGVKAEPVATKEQPRK